MFSSCMRATRWLHFLHCFSWISSLVRLVELHLSISNSNSYRSNFKWILMMLLTYKTYNEQPWHSQIHIVYWILCVWMCFVVYKSDGKWWAFGWTRLMWVTALAVDMCSRTRTTHMPISIDVKSSARAYTLTQNTDDSVPFIGFSFLNWFLFDIIYIVQCTYCIQIYIHFNLTAWTFQTLFYIHNSPIETVLGRWACGNCWFRRKTHQKMPIAEPIHSFFIQSDIVSFRLCQYDSMAADLNDRSNAFSAFSPFLHRILIDNNHRSHSNLSIWLLPKSMLLLIH